MTRELGGFGKMGGFGSGYGMMGWGWLVMVIGFLAMVAVIVAVVLVVVWLVRALTGSPSTGMERETPMEILRRRLAAGEISHDEHERMRQTLER
ncbi:MAG: SHOCT domain-containing protein [Chloroflexi bacterium]|nr:SHOCT domain-containing protein [Chloroflexota bacterium]